MTEHGQYEKVIYAIEMKTANGNGDSARRVRVTVLGAGYTGLTTAAELTLRGFGVDVVAQDLGYRPPLTIVGTQVQCKCNFIGY